MEYVFFILKSSIKNLNYECLHGIWPENPTDISQVLQYKENSTKTILLKCAKVLSSYGSIIRKSSRYTVEKGNIMKNPPIYINTEDFQEKHFEQIQEFQYCNGNFINKILFI
jgi:hypothetical protein